MKTNTLHSMEISDSTAPLLAQKLRSFEDTDAVIVAVTCGAVPLAAGLAQALHLPLEILPSRIIRHPADPMKTIGSVTVDAVSLQEDIRDIPRDYIAHQVLLSQCTVKKDYESFYAKRTPVSLRYKTVILVDEMLLGVDPLACCLRSVLRQVPLKVVVAAPWVTAEAARRVSEIADQVEFIDMVSDAHARITYRGYGDAQLDRARTIFEEYTGGRELVRIIHDHPRSAGR